MSKLLHYFFVFFLLMTTTTMLANDYNVDGVNYMVDSTKMEAVVVNGSYSGTINIPNSINIDGKNYSVTALAGLAFSRCDKLTSVSIPNSVRMIGPGCFAYCSSLKSLTIPDSVRFLGHSCFYECSSLSTVDLPKKIKDLDGVFYHCTGLKSIIIPDSVTSLSTFIPDEESDMRLNVFGCFAGCTNLTSIIIPNSVTVLGEGCFVDCTSLQNIKLPNSVTSLGDGCFWGCTSLKSLIIPKSVVFLGSECIDGCPNLKEITCLANTPPTMEHMYSLNDKTLYVPEYSIQAYKVAEYWKDFGKILPFTTSGILTSNMKDVDFEIKNGKLMFHNSLAKETISIYSSTGELLCSSNDSFSINLKKGQLIIVKVGNKSSKMLIK